VDPIPAVTKGDALHEKVTATLRFMEQGLPEDLRPLCVPLGLHERFVAAKDLVAMGVLVGGGWGNERVGRFLQALAVAGLVTPIGQDLHALHPALTGFLRNSAADNDTAPWERAFIDRMASIAQAVTPLLLHEQRGAFFVHYAIFHQALRLADTHRMDRHVLALMQSLAAYALNIRDFTEAEHLFAALAQRTHDRDPQGEAAAYHQLGMVAEERRDFDAAENWYLESLAVSEKHGYEDNIARIYHELGVIAAERRDFSAAQNWYLKSLAISKKQHSEDGVASNYHQLGVVAQEQRDFDTAEAWYLKSLAIEEKLGNEDGAASTYHQLGIVAEERKDLDGAEKWYRKSLAISEKLNIENCAASSYHHLGRVAQERPDLDAAEAWYLKSLAISEKQGNEHCAGITYHHLGMIASGQRDFDAAEAWYLKSLVISEKQSNEHGAASTYGQLGVLALLRGGHEASADWLIRCVKAFRGTSDTAGVERNTLNFLRNDSAAPTELRPRLRAMWTNADLPPLPDSRQE